MSKIGDKRMAELIKEFHEFWKRHDEPDPISNKYLALNRAFFYVNGVKDGMKRMYKELEAEDEAL